MPSLFSAIALLWDTTRGARLAPWKSPYIRWRIETFEGLPAESLQRLDIRRFLWKERRRLWRFLWWAARMRVEQKV